MSILKDETGCKVKNNNSITVKLMFTFFTNIIYNCKDVWNTCAILLNVWIKFSVPDFIYVTWTYDYKCYIFIVYLQSR